MVLGEEMGKALGQPEKGRAGKQRFRLLWGFQAARAGRQRNAGKPVAKGKRQRQPEISHGAATARRQMVYSIGLYGLARCR